MFIKEEFFYLILALVFVFLAGIFFLFVRNRTFPVINLFFIRIFHGRFSYEYLEFFKKNDLRNPLNNCIKDEITIHISVFFKELKNSLFLTSDVPVEFTDFPFSSSYKKLRSLKGEPECMNIAKFDSTRAKVVGYNDTFEEIKMKSLYYFIGETFFMGELIFSETRRIDPEKVISLISKKYLKGQKVSADSFYITDPKGHKIHFHDNGFYCAVKYLCTSDPDINKILDKVFSQLDPKNEEFRRAMAQEELLNRL